VNIAESVSDWVDANWHEDMSLGEWWQRLADAGYAFPMWSSDFGGRDLGRGDATEISRVLGTKGVIGPPTGNAPNMGVPTLLKHGTEAQKDQFAKPVVSGQEAWCQLFSEPGAGSDLASLATKAERDGDEFVVTGQKVWNSSAESSEWGMLLARTNPDEPKHRGITWMMIDMRQPGVEARPLVQMNGGAEFCEVFMTEARVPVENVVGDLNDGWNIARTTLLFERGAVGQRFAKGLVQMKAGSAPGNLDRPVGELVVEAKRAIADPNKRFDVMIGAKSMIHLAREMGVSNDPVVRDKVADYYVRSEVHRLTILRSRAKIKSGQAGPEGSTIKLSLAMLAHQSRDTSLSILGAEGMVVGPDARDNGKVQKAGMSAHAPSLGGGTNEIQRNIIGERTLGLPREPSTDADVPFRDLLRS
jgi:alkylation response protein AidB-like acyl-CoA dehydrogenase